MLSLPPSVLFGQIITELCDIVSFAQSCTRACSLTKSQFVICCGEDGDVIVYGKSAMFKIELWEYPYVSPSFTDWSETDEMFSGGRDFAAALCNNYGEFGVLRHDRDKRHYVFGLTELAIFTCFGKKSTVLGRIAAVYIGEPRDFGGGTVKIGDMTVVVAEL